MRTFSVGLGPGMRFCCIGYNSVEKEKNLVQFFPAMSSCGIFFTGVVLLRLSDVQVGVYQY